VRLREWRGTVRQYTIVLVIAVCLIGLAVGVIPRERFYSTVPPAFVVVTLLSRVADRRLPKFLE
jgi:hypothetical protein